MSKKLFFHYCIVLSLLSSTLYLYPDSGSWSPNAADTMWTNDVNWCLGVGGTHPNGISQSAAFVGYNPSGVVDSATDITLGTLIFDLPNFMTIGFTGGNRLIFDRTDILQNQANIYIPTAQTHQIDTPITINSAFLEINAGSSSSLYLSQPISGVGGIIVNVDNNTHLNVAAANSYAGETIILSGFWRLNGPGNTKNVPGNVTVYGSGILEHDNGIADNYAAGSQISLNGGLIDMQGTSQTIERLVMIAASEVYGESGSTLHFTAPAPFSPALIIGDNSAIYIDTLVLDNGGPITNNSGFPGEGFILGNFAPAGFTTVDLNGNSGVFFNADNNSTQGGNEFDLGFNNVKCINGSINKVGAGTLLIEGTQSQIVDTSILNGTIQVGRQGSPALIEGPATITTAAGDATLQGFGTLGSVANQVNVVNNLGRVIPAAPLMIGDLTIVGDYQQNGTAFLFIQAFNTSTVDKLIVNSGSVSLGGALGFITYPGNTFSAGDEIVVIDNTGGTGITGTFALLIAEVPSGLSASVIYEQFQVKIRFDTCGGTPTIAPPINLRGSQIVDRFAVQRDVINQLVWEASPTPDVVAYRVYRNNQLIGVTNSTAPLTFQDHQRDLTKLYTYGVTAVGFESNPITTTIP